jgi:error-prone DNA polymerase
MCPVVEVVPHDSSAPSGSSAPAVLRYAELHTLTNFSFLKGASHPEELVSQAKALGYDALAITDECSLAGVVRAHMAAKHVELKLIIGAEFMLEEGIKLVLIAPDRRAYGDLSELITVGRSRAEKGTYRLALADVRAYGARCLAIWIPERSANRAQLQQLQEIFPGQLWIAVEHLLQGDERAHYEVLRALGESAGVPLVAAGDVQMHKRERKRLHDVLTAIRLGTTVATAGQRLLANGERRLRSRALLARLYPPALLEETLKIVQRCHFSLDELKYEYPEEIVPRGETPTSYLRRLTEEGIRKRWPQGVKDWVRDLIERELVLIAELGYEPFFLTVYDLVKFAREQAILCQGRGSAANSAVCYCLGITEVDPERGNTLFERFISKERNEPPDIDVDFEHERREEVIQYVYNKYGRHRAALAATVITYRARSAVRDVGKALGFSLEQVDALAKEFQWWEDGQVNAERLRAVGLDPQSPRMRQFVELVGALRGFPRHLSQHVGGFVIARDSLKRLVPIENASMPDRTVIQWDKDDLEALGLLKVDCLALGMLTAIRKTFDLVQGYRGERLCMEDILRHEDPKVYEMISRADTAGVFQIESRAQMSMLPRLKPRCFYDLVIEIAIVRPGPIQGNMVHPYLRRRDGMEPIEYPSAEVESVLARTLGVPIFQEQVIKLAMVAADFTPGEADGLRRSIAGWRRNGGLDTYGTRLIEGMRAKGYAEEYARRIYQQILGFGEYGFPEAHSASFALLAYVSSWLKCYEPAAFLAALLNSQPMGFYSPSQLVQDARRHGVEVRPVDATVSDWDCTLERSDGDPLRTSICSREMRTPGAAQPAVRLGLRQVRGLSQAGAERLVAARRQGPFRDVVDLARRAQLNRRDLDCLANADALRGFAGHRHRAQWAAAGVEPSQPLLETTTIPEALPLLRAPTEAASIVADYASVGLTLGRHPLALLRRHLARQRCFSAEELMRFEHGSTARVAGIVVCRQHPGSANGVTFLTLEDETGNTNVVVWLKLAQRYRRPLTQARLLLAEGEIQRQGEILHLVARRLEDCSHLLGKLSTRSRDFQ